MLLILPILQGQNHSRTKFYMNLTQGCAKHVRRSIEISNWYVSQTEENFLAGYFFPQLLSKIRFLDKSPGFGQFINPTSAAALQGPQLCTASSGPSFLVPILLFLQWLDLMLPSFTGLVILQDMHCFHQDDGSASRVPLHFWLLEIK